MEIQNDKDILHITYPGSVWDVIGAAYVSVRNRALKQRMKEQLKDMTDDEALAKVDQFVTLIDTSSLQES